MKQYNEERLEWNGIPVLTTKMLAERLGVFENNIHKNFSNNKERFVENKDYFALQGADLKKLRKIVPEHNRGTDLLSNMTRSITLWAEGGACNHAKIAETDEAWEAFLYLRNAYFRQREALRAIAAAHNPESQILLHTKRDVQIKNSKEINTYFYENGGTDSIKEYNTKSCKLHSGMYPKQLKEIAKKHGLKAKQMTSGKEVLRHLKPEIAACMSLTDDLCKMGGKLEEMVPISKSAEPVFVKMLELGMLNRRAS